jgi:diaminopimelate decarboxylase
LSIRYDEFLCTKIDLYHSKSFIKGKEKHPKVSRYDIVGSLCENNDKFAIDRELPQLEIGDIIIIHDVGAHGIINKSTTFLHLLKCTRINVHFFRTFNGIQLQWKTSMC